MLPVCAFRSPWGQSSKGTLHVQSETRTGREMKVPQIPLLGEHLAKAPCSDEELPTSVAYRYSVLQLDHISISILRHSIVCLLGKSVQLYHAASDQWHCCKAVCPLQFMHPTSITMGLDKDWVYPASPASVQVIPLTPIDQMQARVYITFVTCFSLQATVNPQEVYSALRNGLALTLSEVPLLGGRLTPEEGERGRLQVQIDEGHGIRFPFRDLSHPSSEVSSEYSYGDLKASHFPPSALDGKDLPPVDMVPTTPKPAVMEVQANAVRGGLLLVTCVHHAALDAMGVAKILKVWARNTSLGNDASLPKLLSEQATDRTPLMKVLTKADPKDTPEFRILNGAKEPTIQERIGAVISSPPKECCTFYFSLAKLAELKQLASSSNQSDPWVSTHDALCGHLWRRISIARGFKSSDCRDSQTSHVQFACAIQGRQRLSPPLPDDYLGNVSFYCPVTLTSNARLPIHLSLHRCQNSSCGAC